MLNDRRYVIYKHTSPDDKVYIGQTRQNPPDKRWGKGGRNYFMNYRFMKDIDKFGWHNFKHEILVGGLNKCEANILEKYYINHYNSEDIFDGYNQTLWNGKETNEIFRVLLLD